MDRRVRILVALTLLGLLTLGATGCQQMAEKAAQTAVEKATGVKVDDKSGSVTVTGKDGKTATVSGGEGKLPEGIPADLPVYTGDTKSGGKIESPEGATYTFTILTADDAKSVVDWYKKELGAKGWTISSATTMESDGKVSGSIVAKKDKADLMISVTPDSASGKTSISAVMGVKTK
jgi:hypothetical protein